MLLKKISKTFQDLTQALMLGVLAFALFGCAGSKTFHDVARVGDTVALAAGWKHNFRTENITVTIRPKKPIGPGWDDSLAVIINPGDPAIRSVVNFYPDPVSSIMVSRQTNQNLTDGALTYADTVSQFTDGGTDWWQTTVFIDLPVIPLGRNLITISNADGETVDSEVFIVDGAGQSAELAAQGVGPLSEFHLDSLERVPHYTVHFAADTIPYAIEAQLSHSPDIDVDPINGKGRAGVINPRGEIKNLHWTDTGSGLKVLLFPAGEQPLSNMVDFKFFVAGGIENLLPVSAQGYDADGNPVNVVMTVY